MPYVDIAGGCGSDTQTTNVFILQSGVAFTISGQIVTISGQPVTISGNVVQISGQVVTVVLSGCICVNSGTGVITQSGIGVIANVMSGTGVVIQSGTGVIIQSGHTVNISGQSVVITSGQGVIIQSGVGVITTIDSGLGVITQSGIGVITSVSGNIIQISGQTVISKTSGETIKLSVPSSLINGYSLIGAVSGGTVISSGVIIHVSIQNMPGNDIMWIGATGVNSGAGYLLVAGNEKEINIDNLNKVYAYAQTSGEYVCYLAEVE